MAQRGAQVTGIDSATEAIAVVGDARLTISYDVGTSEALSATRLHAL